MSNAGQFKIRWLDLNATNAQDTYARTMRQLSYYFASEPGKRPTYRMMAVILNNTFGVALSAEAIRMIFRRWRRLGVDARMFDTGLSDITQEMRRVSRADSNARKGAGEERIYDADTLKSERDYAEENAQLRRVNRRLFEQLQASKDRVADLVQATLDGARDAMLSLGPLVPTTQLNTDRRVRDGEAALWHLTDWQGSKKTTTYNSDVMRERVMRFVRKAERITNIQRADHPVRECVIAFGGDMVEGLFNFPTQPFEIDATIFGQFVTVSRLIVETVQCALSIYERVQVVAEWGNHGRIGSKRDSVPRSDNIDRMTYELARQLLSSEERLTWHDSAEDVQRIEIGHYRALLIHGDEVGRNGFASPMQIVRHANQWRSGAYPWEFRDVYIGHYHTHCDWSMANGVGSVYQTGSTESDNRYAREMMAAAAVPSQRLHFIDTERGRVSAQYKIYLDED